MSAGVGARGPASRSRTRSADSAFSATAVTTCPAGFVGDRRRAPPLTRGTPPPSNHLALPLSISGTRLCSGIQCRRDTMDPSSGPIRSPRRITRPRAEGTGTPHHGRMGISPGGGLGQPGGGCPGRGPASRCRRRRRTRRRGAARRPRARRGGRRRRPLTLACRGLGAAGGGGADGAPGLRWSSKRGFGGGAADDGESPTDPALVGGGQRSHRAIGPGRGPVTASSPHRAGDPPPPSPPPRGSRGPRPPGRRPGIRRPLVGGAALDTSCITLLRIAVQK